MSTARQFFTSFYCVSGTHCGTCRARQSGYSWRQHMQQAFVDIHITDWECPRGRPWDGSPTVVEYPICSVEMCAVCRDTGDKGRLFRTQNAITFGLSPADFECPQGKPWSQMDYRTPLQRLNASIDLLSTSTKENQMLKAFRDQLMDIHRKAKIGSCGCAKTVLQRRLEAKLQYYYDTYARNSSEILDSPTVR